MRKPFKKYTDDERIKIVGEIDRLRNEGSNILDACQTVGIDNVTYYAWRVRLNGKSESAVKPKQKIKHQVFPLPLESKTSSRITLSGTPQELGDFFRALRGEA